MPAVTSGKVLVTGATGFIAAWVVEQALEKGYSVIGTVRSTKKGDYLKKRFEGKPFEYVIIEDQSQPNAFDDVVSKHDFDGVLHTASPFHYDAEDPDVLIKPAVKGTEGILEAIQKHAPKVKRVVITSSVASIMSPSAKAPKTFTDKDWNEESPKAVKEHGKDATGPQKYQASKTFAEKAARDFVEQHKPEFDIVTIHPSLVLGPILHYVKEEADLNTSVKNIWSISQGSKTSDDLPGFISNWVDVRDVAAAHLAALAKEDASGKRYITSNGPLVAQRVIEILTKHDSSLKLAQGKPGAAEEAEKRENAVYFDGTPATTELGVEYYSLDQTVVDLYESVKARKAGGWQ